ncbi:hypothetical protein [Sneathiella litorea]|uniref:Uncharacterized protein n=1 Tax=Sneathiella litorea TaxID=2606216 RepID=A0A6L8WAF6_9PROT|nr:hypothetical protein [Sneathiella litorea]MZR31463.1 hypothetical protein [Sneathiella litorea]
MPRKRNISHDLQYLEYLFEIENWTTDYLFSIGKGYTENLPYTEYLDMAIQAKMISPEKYANGYVRLTILGNRDIDHILDDPESAHYEPQSVGTLTLRGDRREYLGSLPSSALRHIISRLEGNRVRFILLHGQKLRYGSAPIDSIAFKENYDPENY